MLRDTMINTIPVAMMAMEVLCTERFHRLRDVRKSPPLRMWKAIQIAMSANISPKSRVSISVELTTVRQFLPGCGVGLSAPDESFGVSTVVICPPWSMTRNEACPRPRSPGRGHVHAVRC
jgi:hypothetical protein